MTLTMLLLLLTITMILGIILGIIRKNKLHLVISSVVLALIICFILFLAFVLIPSM